MGVPYAEVIGDPIAHSKSPLIHQFWLRKLGIEGDYRATRVLADELAGYFDDRRQDPAWRGCNVTIPHKERVLGFVDDVRDCGIGAVNCVVREEGRLVGRNTDIDGFGEATPASVDTSRPVCLLGSGGAARVVIASLDVLAVYQWHLVARDRARAQRLFDRFGMAGRIFDFDQAEAAVAGSIGVVNATPLGMIGFPAMPGSVLRGFTGIRRRRAFAIDMVYAPPRTEFLRAAMAARIEAIDGLTMLIGQAAAAFVRFFEAPAPRGRDLELREILTG
jgi:shikimate dehydrogenase